MAKTEVPLPRTTNRSEKFTTKPSPALFPRPGDQRTVVRSVGKNNKTEAQTVLRRGTRIRRSALGETAPQNLPRGLRFSRRGAPSVSHGRRQAGD